MSFKCNCRKTTLYNVVITCVRYHFTKWYYANKTMFNSNWSLMEFQKMFHYIIHCSGIIRNIRSDNVLNVLQIRLPKTIHANSTDLSLLPPTDFRCFPTDLKKSVIFFFIVNCSHVDYSCRFLPRINVYKSKLFRPFP
jgi:hypothetical protein